MSNWFRMTKVFAFFFLSFSGIFSISAQTVTRDSIYTMPAGTRITVRMDNEVNSRVASVNDTFTATVDEPVSIRGVTVLEKGTVIEGRIKEVRRASYAGRSGRLSVAFESLRLVTGVERRIEGIMVARPERNSGATRTLATLAGSIASGAVIGTVASGPGGTLLGAGVGPGIGLGALALRKGKQARIRADEKFEIELTKQVTLPVVDF